MFFKVVLSTCINRLCIDFFNFTIKKIVFFNFYFVSSFTDDCIYFFLLDCYILLCTFKIKQRQSYDSEKLEMLQQNDFEIFNNLLD